MNVPLASLIIKRYQMEDFVDMILSNNYIVEVKNNDESTVLITVYQNFNKEESEEK